jgi:hypothetical protein
VATEQEIRASSAKAVHRSRLRNHGILAPDAQLRSDDAPLPGTNYKRGGAEGTNYTGAWNADG